MDKMIEKNKKLIEQYPFLLPCNVWSGEPIEDYDYTYTMLIDLPGGWVKAFGEQMCADIKEAIELDVGDINDWHILQWKEKYGGLRLYSNWTTPRLDEVIEKYEQLSLHTCHLCGAPATRYSTGWILPWCDRCTSRTERNYKPIESGRFL